MPDTTKPVRAAAPQAAPRGDGTPTTGRPLPAKTSASSAVTFLSKDELSPDVARAELIDRLIHAWQARFTLAVSPAALLLAFADWSVHLLNAPGKQTALVEKAMRKWVRLALYLSNLARDPDCAPCIEPLPQDHRFRSPAWQQQPFSLIYQSFLLTQQWWYNATIDIRGVSPAHERVVDFTMRQLLDIVAPSNFLLTNPEVLQRTLEEGGQNFLRGWTHLVEDWERGIAGRRPVGSENFVPGRDVAITPGKVVFRNELIELIQYAPTTETVRPEPVLIVPAWIMKYYILDLSPGNSLVRHLVAQGFTVFIISWLNPGPAQRDWGMADYLRLGLGAAVKAVGAICPEHQIHACGYCLGGTLLSIGAAAMARDGDNRFKTVTLLAAQVDFTEAGELTLFINDSQVAYLEDMMWEQGYLDARQMSGAFQLLRSNDLIWSRMVKQYLEGERDSMNDLMAWNADSTRMPYRMHSEYLRHLFLDDDLAEGRYLVDSRPVALEDVRAPLFVVGTQTDHVAPWRSVYKANLYFGAPVTFVLTSGGHNVGIVSEPGHPRRSYQVAECRDGQRYVDPNTWAASTPSREGSWWPAWFEWLAARSGAPEPPPALGAGDKGYPPLGDAPGSYVLQS